MRYAHATNLFPRNLARLVNATAYSDVDAAPVGRQPSADYERSMSARRLRDLYGLLHEIDAPARGAAMVGSRYQGGYSAPARCR